MESVNIDTLLFLGSLSIFTLLPRRQRRLRSPQTVLDLIGDTPMLFLPRLSKLYGVEIYGKAEYTNPGGSVKDRAALSLILEAEEAGDIGPGGCVVEGTGGNTGVGLALVAAARGYGSYMCMPENASTEKQVAMRSLGSETEVCSTSHSASDAGHYTQRARSVARSRPGAVHTDQFLSLPNYRAHYNGTGPEIASQLPDLDVFACGAGTGGTIAGAGKRLKETTGAKVVLVDFAGSGLKSYVSTGEWKKVRRDVANDLKRKRTRTHILPF